MIPTLIPQAQEEYINFRKYWLVLKRRWLPAGLIFSSVTSVFILTSLVKEPIYQAEAQILIGSDKSSQLVGLKDERGQIEVLGKDSNPIVTEAEILQSRPIVEQVIQQLDLTNGEGQPIPYQQVAGNFSVKPIVGTDILQVFYQDPDPEKAASIVNHLIDAYIQEDTSSNRAAAAAAREFINGQLPKVESTVAKAEENLQQFKTENKISSLSQEATNNIDAIKSLESEIDKYSADLEDINGRFEQLRSQLNLSWEDAVAISSLDRSAISQLVAELQTVKLDLAKQRDRFVENSPQIVNLQERERELTALLEQQVEAVRGEQKDSLRDKLLNISGTNSEQKLISEFADLGVTRSGLLKRLTVLKSNLQDRKQNITSLPLLEKQQRELERRVNATQSTYQMLLSRLQDTQVVENQNVGNVRVIAPAVTPQHPAGSAKRKLAVFIGGAIGAIFGVAFAFLLELQDRSIKSSQEAEELFGYPLRGVIPNLGRLTEANESEIDRLQPTSLDRENSLPVRYRPQQILQAAEAYEMLQANLKFLSTDWNRQAIAVTSSVPREGKSQVAANLARSMAELDRKVLLVDADLRRPSQHHLINLPNSTGLSDVLSRELPWKEAVQEVTDNFHVLTAGDVPDNPLSLMSWQMATVIKSLLDCYDCVILDTPPLTGVADTIVLGDIVDGFLLVVRPGVVDYESAIAARKLLKDTEQHIFGIVANGVNLQDEPYVKSYTKSY